MNARAIRAAVAAASLVVFVFASPTFARDAYWHGVLSDVWSDGLVPPAEESNWYADPPPDGTSPQRVPNGTAIFANGALRTSVRVTKPTTVGRIRFTSDAPPYLFRILRNQKLILNTAGLINQSSATPLIIVSRGAHFILRRKARFASGGATSADIRTIDTGTLSFLDESAGGNASVINRGGGTEFFDMSSADDMTIRNGNRGQLNFFDNATGGQARLHNEHTGVIRFLGDGPAGNGLTPVGMIDNDGRVVLHHRIVRVRNGFTLRSNGTLSIDIRPTGAGKVLVVAGGFVLDGTLAVFLYPGVKPGHYKIIEARGGNRVGRFSTVIFGGRNDLKGRVAYSAKEVRVIIERK